MMMIQQHRFVDGFWWPATTFFRNIPSYMTLASTARYGDIREETFPRMMTLDCCFKFDQMDMYIEASGRAIDAKGDTLLIAKNLPKTFKLETTEDWGVRIVSSDQGVEELYMRQTNVPQLLVCSSIVLRSLERISKVQQSPSIAHSASLLSFSMTLPLDGLFQVLKFTLNLVCMLRSSVT